MPIEAAGKGEPMKQASKDRLAFNVRNAARMASNWVMTAVGVGAAIYLRLSAEQQQAILDHLPVEPWLVPIIASVVGIAARMWPQPKLSASLEDHTKGNP